MLESILQEMQELGMKGIWAEYIFHNIADNVIEKLKKIKSNIKKPENLPKEFDVSLDASKTMIINQILFNIKFAKNWSKNINFQDLKSQKKISQIYVNLDFYLTPSKNQLHINNEERIPLLEALNFEQSSYLVLGGPGAGKTTLSKYVVNQLLDNPDIFNINFTCPIVIQFRDINSRIYNTYEIEKSLYLILMETFGIKLEYNSSILDYNKEQQGLISNFYYSVIKRVITDFIDEGKFLIILDGFDEISDNSLKEAVKKEIAYLTTALVNSRILLTSRTGDIYLSTEKMSTRQICPLNKSQIIDFIHKYIENKQEAENLINKILNSPFYDMAMRPINLAHLCAIYERYKNIPDKPKSIYKKIVNLLLEEWDLQRGIVRETIYAGFSNDRKIEFLSRLSYELTVRYNAVSFSEKELLTIYSEISENFQLAHNEGLNVIKEIESHNGLFLQIGYDKYEFSHKSIQEFLCADFIVKSSLIVMNRYDVLKMPNEFAVATGLATLPGHFLSDLLMNKLNFHAEELRFIYPFLERLRVEKPDYEVSELLGIAFIYLHTVIVNLAKESTDFKTSEKDGIQILEDRQENLSEFHNLYESFISNLFQHPNISNSIARLRNIIQIPKQYKEYLDMHYDLAETPSINMPMFRIEFKGYSSYSQKNRKGFINLTILKILR